MESADKIKENLVFGLDIGTRNIVGVVGYMERQRFQVIAMASKEHETRAMLDGQIHDIYKVGDTIRAVKNQLETVLDTQLKDVCIAAAGRVLRTLNVSAEYTFEEETRVTQEDIYSLQLLAVEKAHNEINNDSAVKFFCVGNTPIRYRLNGYDINNLEGHKANDIGVDLIATFLPEEVVDGLYEAVNYAGLQVANLTLEPIAAMNIAIPENYRLLNIALIDVGAGTSDICITRDGSIMAYGMIPIAGDEITEIIAKNCLVDFNAAEKIKLQSGKKKGTITYKDIMGITQKIPVEEVRKLSEEVVERMAQAAAERIIELNGGRATNAVFIVGGGGKIAGYDQRLARHLKIPAERVAVRGAEVLTSVDFQVEGYKKDSLFVTPVGICTNYYSQKNNFVFVTVNHQRLKLYDNNRLTVVDAIMQIGFPNDKLFPRRGEALEFTVNKAARLVRGTAGEGALVKLNGRVANLNSHIEQNDSIEVTESTIGGPGSITIEQLPEYHSSIEFIVEDRKISCPRFAYVNGELKSPFYDICQGDQVMMENFYTVEQIFAFLDIDISNQEVYVNNVPASQDTKVYENFTISLKKSEPVAESYDQLKMEPEDPNAMGSEAETGADAESQTEAAGAVQNKVQEENAFTQSQGYDKIQNNEQAVPGEIIIMVNNTPVRLTGKAEYVLVDLFQFYDFDLSKPQGSKVVLQLNGVEGEYMAPIKDGDFVTLYWDK